MGGERGARHFQSRGSRGNDRPKARITKPARSDGRNRPAQPFRQAVRRRDQHHWRRRNGRRPEGGSNEHRDNAGREEGRDEEPDWGTGATFDLAEVCTRLKALPNLQRDVRDREVQSLFEVLSHSSFDDFMHQHATNPSQIEPLLEALQGLTCFPRRMRETLARKLARAGCDMEASQRRAPQRKLGNARLWGQKKAAQAKQRTGANSIPVAWQPPNGADMPHEALQDEPEEKHEGAKAKSAPRPPPQLTSTDDGTVQGPAGRGHSSTTPAWMSKISDQNAPDGSAGRGRGRDVVQHTWLNPAAPSIPRSPDGYERHDSGRREGAGSPRTMRNEPRHTERASSSNQDGRLDGRSKQPSREDRYPYADGRPRAGDGRHPSKARGHDHGSRRSRSRPARQDHRRHDTREQPSRGGRNSRSRARAPENSRHRQRPRSTPPVRLSAAKQPPVRVSPARRHRETPSARGRDERLSPSRQRHGETPRPPQAERRHQRPPSAEADHKRRRKASLQANRKTEEKDSHALMRQRVAALKLGSEQEQRQQPPAAASSREPAASSSHPPPEKRSDGGSNRRVPGRFGRQKHSPARGHDRSQQEPDRPGQEEAPGRRPQAKGKEKGVGKGKPDRRKHSPSQRRSRSKAASVPKQHRSDDRGRFDQPTGPQQSPKHASPRHGPSPRQKGPWSGSAGRRGFHRTPPHQVSHASQMPMPGVHGHPPHGHPLHPGMLPGMPHMPQQGQSPYGVPPAIPGVPPAMPHYYGQANLYASPPPVLPPPPGVFTGGQHCMPPSMPAMPALPPVPVPAPPPAASSPLPPPPPVKTIVADIVDADI
mmetsp:Transcript_58735/g.108377  ORF Transcript_58735/g.108377 Transcript_58735/m.108377 type:complete len:822 (-) Transcript_58735:100-2565(-)